MLVLKKNDLGVNLSNLRNSSYFFSYLYFLVILLLLGIVLKIGVSKISQQRKTLAEIKSKEALLIDKEKTLSKARDELIGIFYRPASIALPVENPALVSFLELKNLLNLYLLPLDKYSINIGGEISDESTVGRTSLDISVFGKMDQIISFLKDVEKTSPLSVINKLSFSSEKDVLNADITIDSFWSPFLSKKVDVDTPLQKITESEKSVLVNLGELKQPTFSNPQPTGPFNRTNPFSSL